jgi:ABC-type phosphate/phosphonate transport system substrate-binding protein
MYSVSPAATAAWKQLFAWLSRHSGIALDVIEHAYPAPLSELWSRSDLACAFMCGFPFIRSEHPPQPIAAPVPSSTRNGSRPVYVTDFVVSASSPFHSLEDTFGGRVGYTVQDSHSGYNALRHHLLPFRRARGRQLYRESVGPLYTPRRVIEAIRAGSIDVGPLDGYALDLMLRHEPDLQDQIRVVATSDPAPIPFLVASRSCPEEVVERLRLSMSEFGDAPECAPLRDDLCLARFAPVRVGDYDLIAAWAREADDVGCNQPF